MTRTISKDLFLGAVAVTLAAGGLPTIFFQGQIAEAQQQSGDITAAAEGQPFGGETMGTVSIDSPGRRTNISADLNAAPGEGNVF
jgi:hypothetical protein